MISSKIHYCHHSKAEVRCMLLTRKGGVEATCLCLSQHVLTLQSDVQPYMKELFFSDLFKEALNNPVNQIL